MGTRKIGVKLNDTACERIKRASRQLNRPPHWLIKQAISHYLDALEDGTPIEHPLPAMPEADASPKKIEELSKPFIDLAKQILPQSIMRASVTAAWCRSETLIVPFLLEQARHPEAMAESIQVLAGKLAHQLRHQKRSGYGRVEIVQDLLQEFALSSQEGIALMCLAEALLRIPDKATRDALIRDKIKNGNWQIHLGKSYSLFVNAATWGLLIIGKLVKIDNDITFLRSLNRIIKKCGEPLIRKGMDMAMRLMGKQFVIGEHISEALANAHRLEHQGFCYSYDMLGEAALTEADAQAYLHSYQQAIDAIGKASKGRGIYEGPGISIKLSALHPRYCRSQYKRVMEELYPRLLQLTLLARKYDIGLNIDAEEADRLEISLDLLTKLCFEPELAGWNGIGFVIQAYQKRCSQLIDELIDLSNRSHHRLMIRLVKGAYWDSEIKRAQMEGLEGYPVFTRKVYTDLSYLACARKLLSVPHHIYPQFATHNANTLAAIYHFAGHNYYTGQYEFQCLHGMGAPLYDQVVGKISDGKLDRHCRIYAPVGTHKTLLGYLVRRLLENGANTSFVNCIADITVPIEQLITNPVQEVSRLALCEGCIGQSHPKIPLPCDLYGSWRRNAAGLDLANEHHLASLSATLLDSEHETLQAAPIIVGDASNGSVYKVINPADHLDVVGTCQYATSDDVAIALSAAVNQGAGWSVRSPANRAAILQKAANRLEEEMQSLIGLLVREAGKSFTNALAEVREAVDFLRYYACQVMRDFDNESYRPLGPVVCISPWNFPLAIFTGQIAAALAAGNTVLAKPAEQTPLIASRAVMMMLDAGVPQGVLQLLPGKGETVGALLVSDPRVRGVMFTGSTQVARLLQTTITSRLDPQGHTIPLIAETGGMNAMLVDSSALTEQVVIDVMASAFDSAGQRCSALRLLCIQEDVAERTLRMLRGAMAECILGNPNNLATDIGPVIDAEAKSVIDNHIAAMRKKNHPVWQTNLLDARGDEQGTFVPLTLIELDSVEELTDEIFGPVLHVVRYQRNALDNIIDQINGSGYGLTLGLHTRIDETIQYVTDRVHVGNCYINRNIVGAVVGVQPFGGEGLSGTGPKAGGPLYLYRLLSQRGDDAVLPSLQALDVLQAPDYSRRESLQQGHSSLLVWMEDQYPALAVQCRRWGETSQAGSVRYLTGPTGEKNSYQLLPRERILCLAYQDIDLLIQLSAVTSIGSKVLWDDAPHTRLLFTALPEPVRNRITFLADWRNKNVMLDAVLFHGETDQLRSVAETLSTRPGPLIVVHGYAPGDSKIALERLFIERAVSVNTAAAGGNASLMTID
ncbi:MAG: trifunctional transcriptional regulator/proline dehydrogenase/L-glutamate gamma-semialdehyde dehydrogenase [Sodalis sp. (in: enterobacteria)]